MHNNKNKPICCVLVSTDDITDKDNKEQQLAKAELFSQGNATLKNRKKYYKDSAIVVKNNIYCFNSNKKGLSNIKQELVENKDSILCVVGHHEIFGKIGVMNTDGFTPFELADKIALELDDDISKISNIYFYVCNSATLKTDNSYCYLFYDYMKTRYKVENLVVGGFDGFIYEDTKHKKTYLTETYNDYKKKVRADENMIFYKNIK
jgi:hypothetical protein